MAFGADGFPDVAVASCQATGVEVFHGSGTGTFAAGGRQDVRDCPLAIDVCSTITPTLQQQDGLPVGSGVLVTGLAAHGPAQQAGLTPGDVIVTFNATAITSYDDLLTALANEQPGARVRVSVVHPSGQHQTYTITLSQLPINGNGYD